MIDWHIVLRKHDILVISEDRIELHLFAKEQCDWQVFASYLLQHEMNNNNEGWFRNGVQGNGGRGSPLSVRVLNVRIRVQGQGNRQFAVTVSESA